jgi:hypothetical protein
MADAMKATGLARRVLCQTGTAVFETSTAV